jgi:regulator of cell morphogenesis and NO signaling
VKEQVPIILVYLDRLTRKHGDARPDLQSTRTVFGMLASELMRHLDKEEKILFPFIRAMAECDRAGTPAPALPFGTIRNPIRMMEEEHQDAAGELAQLRLVTAGYAPPPEACATWRACYAALEAFERDLHTHVHLENSVLFPAALRLEERLAAR